MQKLVRRLTTSVVIATAGLYLCGCTDPARPDIAEHYDGRTEDLLAANRALKDQIDNRLMTGTSTSTFEAFFHGYYFASPGQVLTDNDLFGTYEGNSGSTPQLTGTFTDSGYSANMEITETGTASVFVSKDSFTGTLSDTWGGPFGAFNSDFFMLDTVNSSISASALDSAYDAINWGTWVAAAASPGTQEVVGFFAGGRTAVDSTPELIPDITAIAAASNPAVTYTGIAMAYLNEVGSNNALVHLDGTSTLIVDFLAGTAVGTLDFDNTAAGANTIVSLNGTLVGSEGKFDGTATFIGGATGDFKGGLYRDQAAGVFGAAGPTGGATDYEIAGAFGAKSAAPIPLKSR